MRRYETKEIEEAKAETDELHAEGSTFEELWANQKMKDQQLQDVMCPETPDDCPEANQSGKLVDCMCICRTLVQERGSFD